MTTTDIAAFYDDAIAPLPERDQLLLASTILSRIADDFARDLTKEQEDEIRRRQQAGLQSLRGIANEGSADASLRHDEIIYGTTG